VIIDYHFNRDATFDGVLTGQVSSARLSKPSTSASLLKVVIATLIMA
jgi:hypothetical protein